MANTKDNSVDLAALPYLTRRRICILADCSKAAISRSPLVPVGRRGKVLMYSTADVLAWMRGELGAAGATAAPTLRLVATRKASSGGALERIARIAANGGAQ